MSSTAKDYCTEINLCFRRGDRVTKTFSFYSLVGELVAGSYSVAMTVRNSTPDFSLTDDTDADVLITDDFITILDGTTTDFSAPIVFDFTNVDEGTYKYDIQVSKPNGDRQTYFSGSVIVKDDQSRRT